MKKKVLICVSILVVLLIAVGTGRWYIVESENFYPRHFKLGKFVAVNTNVKCFIYDEETDTFTGDYFTIDLKTKGFANAEGMRIGEDGQSTLIVNDEKVDGYDEMFVLFDVSEEYDYGEIVFLANNVDFTDDGTSIKRRVEYDFYYSADFSELKRVYIYEDEKEPVVAYVADSLEEADIRFRVLTVR